MADIDRGEVAGMTEARHIVGGAVPAVTAAVHAR